MSASRLTCGRIRRSQSADRRRGRCGPWLGGETGPEFLRHAHDEDPAVLRSERSGPEPREKCALRGIRVGESPFVEIPGRRCSRADAGPHQEACVDIAALARLCARAAGTTSSPTIPISPRHVIDRSMDTEPGRRTIGLAGHAPSGRPRPASGSRSPARPCVVVATIGRNMQADDRRASADCRLA